MGVPVPDHPCAHWRQKLFPMIAGIAIVAGVVGFLTSRPIHGFVGLVIGIVFLFIASHESGAAPLGTAR